MLAVYDAQQAYFLRIMRMISRLLAVKKVVVSQLQQDGRLVTVTSIALGLGREREH